MRGAILAFILTCSLPVSLLAQRGMAPSGYYPESYAGETFTGTITAIDAANDSITLRYEKGSKSEEMSLKLEHGCLLPVYPTLVHAKDMPKGSVLTAFYMPKEEEVDGQKKKDYTLFAIRFFQWGDEKVPEKYQQLFPCSTAKFLKFNAYAYDQWH